MKIPQEIIEHIIMLSDKQTIIENRYLLSNYMYKTSLEYNIVDIIHNVDIEALEYKIRNEDCVARGLFNRIILYENNISNTCTLLEYCYKNNIKHDIISLYLILQIKDYDKTSSILNVLYNNNFTFYIFHYYITLEIDSIVFMDFLIGKNIRPDPVLINEIIYSEKIELFLWLNKYDLYTYHDILYKVVKTFNKEYILSCLKYLPLHTVHWTVKKLKDDNVDYDFILWVLVSCLIENHTIFKNNYLYYLI